MLEPHRHDEAPDVPHREAKAVGKATLSRPTHTSDHTSRHRTIYLEPEGEAVGDVFRLLSTTLDSVWGRVVPDILDFCRKLVAALPEE